MTKLQYRAYWPEEKEMHKVSSLDLVRQKIELYAADTVNIEQVKLMRCTGLKDKNGKDVYEGDIIRCTRGFPNSVIWVKELGGMPGWYLSGIKDGYTWTGKEEIIGNIYEGEDI